MKTVKACGQIETIGKDILGQAIAQGHIFIDLSAQKDDPHQGCDPKPEAHPFDVILFDGMGAFVDHQTTGEQDQGVDGGQNQLHFCPFGGPDRIGGKEDDIGGKKAAKHQGF